MALSLLTHWDTMLDLWKQYDLLLGRQRHWDHKRPLCDVSGWHLALMLAAGQVSGVVISDDGRTFVVRGDTYKDKQVTTTQTRNEKGDSVFCANSNGYFCAGDSRSGHDAWQRHAWRGVYH